MNKISHIDFDVPIQHKFEAGDFMYIELSDGHRHWYMYTYGRAINLSNGKGFLLDITLNERGLNSVKLLYHIRGVELNIIAGDVIT